MNEWKANLNRRRRIIDRRSTFQPLNIRGRKRKFLNYSAFDTRARVTEYSNNDESEEFRGYDGSGNGRRCRCIDEITKDGTVPVAFVGTEARGGFEDAQITTIQYSISTSTWAVGCGVIPAQRPTLEGRSKPQSAMYKVVTA